MQGLQHEASKTLLHMYNKVSHQDLKQQGLIDEMWHEPGAVALRAKMVGQMHTLMARNTKGWASNGVHRDATNAHSLSN